MLPPYRVSGYSILTLFLRWFSSIMVNFVLSGKFYQVFRMCFPKFCQMIMKVQSVREYVETKIEKAEKPITDAMVHIITPTRASFFNGITHFPLMPTYRSLNIWLVIIPDIRTWYLYTSLEDLKNLLRTVKTGSKQRRIMQNFWEPSIPKGTE